MKLTTLANGIGKGIFAGLAGTAAMTISSTIEAKLRRRQFSTAPAKAATKALGIETFEDGEAYAKFSNLVHWGYGTGWGVARGVIVGRRGGRDRPLPPRGLRHRRRGRL